MNDALLAELTEARETRTPCALITVVDTRGSCPRAAGSSMLVYFDGRVSGTIGGGKFESLVVADAQKQMTEKKPALKTYTLHEASPESFGAICGGESTIFIQPQVLSEALVLIGAGHCSLAIAKLAIECGLFVTVIDERDDRIRVFPPQAKVLIEADPSKFIAQHKWQSDEALVIVSRNHELDRVALFSALKVEGIAYIGMIGSIRKVNHVFDRLVELGVPREKLGSVYAPIGLDIDADAPAEIAISVLAEVFSVLRKRTANHLRVVKGANRLRPQE
jgi:xanthine dehydrogenase accessory factor